MKFIQRYKLYQNARKEIKTTTVVPSFQTLFRGVKYNLETDRYSITTESFGVPSVNTSFRTVVTDKQSKQTMAFDGNRGADLFFKLQNKYMNQHSL